jgi:hypothetical protein
VVAEIPLTREAVALKRAFTALICAQEGLGAVTMKAMCFSLVSQTACCGRKLGSFTRLYLAAVWFEVRIDKFTVILLVAPITEFKT